MIGRRGALVGAVAGLFAPRIIRTAGLIMPISTLVLPHLVLRTYGYDKQGMLELQETIRLDDFDFERGETRRPCAVRKPMQIWRATVETVGHNRLFDGKEYPLNFGGPRVLIPGDVLAIHRLRFDIS